jgi:hypothetical protein
MNALVAWLVPALAWAWHDSPSYCKYSKHAKACSLCSDTVEVLERAYRSGRACLACLACSKVLFKRACPWACACPHALEHAVICPG